MFKGGCLFIDHASNYVHIEFQQVLTTHATLQAKVAFEEHSRDHGVVPFKYISDNGTAFTGSSFIAHLKRFAQITRYAGVGAHHHNGHAERSIQTIMSIARAMLIHSSMHWPELADTSLWPMVVQHATFLWNGVPDPTTGLSPLDIFSKSRYNMSKFHDIHVWGSPVYVLDKRISDGRKLPRWQPRSTRCMYVGVAPTYASTVPLVLNPSTGSITPQFHVVFDDNFSTVNGDPRQLPDYNSDEWYKLFGESTFQYVIDDNDDFNLHDLNDELEGAISSNREAVARDRVLDAFERARPSSSLDSSHPVHPTTWRESTAGTSSHIDPSPALASRRMTSELSTPISSSTESNPNISNPSSSVPSLTTPSSPINDTKSNLSSRSPKVVVPSVPKPVTTRSITISRPPPLHSSIASRTRSRVANTSAVVPVRRSARIAERNSASRTIGLCSELPPPSHFEVFFTSVGSSSFNSTPTVHVARKRIPPTH